MYPLQSELFEQFVYDLEFGTILEDISDPLELWWPPRRINVAHDNLYHVNIFTDWLYDSYLEKTAVMNMRLKQTFCITLKSKRQNQNT